MAGMIVPMAEMKMPDNALGRFRQDSGDKSFRATADESETV
jgi:hypothetical protein